MDSFGTGAVFSTVYFIEISFLTQKSKGEATDPLKSRTGHVSFISTGLIEWGTTTTTTTTATNQICFPNRWSSHKSRQKTTLYWTGYMKSVFVWVFPKVLMSTFINKKTTCYSTTLIRSYNISIENTLSSAFLGQKYFFNPDSELTMVKKVCFIYDYQNKQGFLGNVGYSIKCA